jgi:hypothetical protein
MKALLTLVVLWALTAAGPALAQQQLVDPDFTPHVAQPAYAADGPVVVIDQAHRNFHTAGGQYAPFAALLRADGFRVETGTTAFSDEDLAGTTLLVIANAGSETGQDTTEPAFTEAEVGAVERWVAGGGSLLLIADHAPFGVAAEGLARRFGVGMGKGWALQRNAAGDGLTTQLIYSRADGGLGEHPITEGVDTVRAFTGQSLVAPEGAVVLLRMADEAWEAADRTRLDAANAAIAEAGNAPPRMEGVADPIGGRAQGLALEHGDGRVVVLGEAGMFSAQLVRFPPDQNRPDMRFGMNVEGLDNDRFALNVMHWLARTPAP